MPALCRWHTGSRCDPWEQNKKHGETLGQYFSSLPRCLLSAEDRGCGWLSRGHTRVWRMRFLSPYHSPHPHPSESTPRRAGGAHLLPVCPPPQNCSRLPLTGD